MVIVAVSRCQITKDDGSISTHKFEVCSVKNAIAVLPITPNGEVLVLENYRYAVNDRFIEVVAGLVEDGESLDAAAIRECEEESGYVPGKVEKVGTFYSSPGLLTEQITLFLAYDLKPTQQKLEAAEDLRVIKMPLNELVEDVFSGAIRDQKTALAIMYAKNAEREGRIKVVGEAPTDDAVEKRICEIVPAGTSVNPDFVFTRLGLIFAKEYQVKRAMLKLMDEKKFDYTSDYKYARR
jgi:ADP-ribose pyrophosphatase